MLIRVILRALPLFCVLAFTLAVFVTETPLDRARTMAKLQHGKLAWAEGLVKCVDPWGNLPVSACFGTSQPRNPPPPD